MNSATAPQPIRVTARIEDGHDSGFIPAFPELDDKWKTMNDHAARAVPGRCEQSRVFKNPSKTSPHVFGEANAGGILVREEIHHRDGPQPTHVLRVFIERFLAIRVAKTLDDHRGDGAVER